MAFDIAALYANIPEKLIDCQVLLEKTIKAYGDAADQEAVTTLLYRKKKGEVIEELIRSKMPVTVVLEIARGKCAEEKQALMLATSAKNRLQKLIDGYRERLFTLRHLGRGIEPMTRSDQ